MQLCWRSDARCSLIAESMADGTIYIYIVCEMNALLCRTLSGINSVAARSPASARPIRQRVFTSALTSSWAARRSVQDRGTYTL